MPRPDDGDLTPPGDDERLSDAEAAAVWQRAAQLQADAVRRLETRAPDAAPDRAVDVVEAPGYSLAHVRAAAAEAGIPAQYVSLALAELRAAPASATAGWQVRYAPRMLGRTPAYLAASRVVAAEPAAALAAAGRVLMGPPFQLAYEETLGPPPLAGGVVVFRLPGSVITAGTERSAARDGWFNLRGVLEAETVRLTLRPAPGDPGRTELTLHADLRSGMRRHVNVALGLGGLAALPLGVAGVGVSAVAGAGLALGAATAGALVAAVAVPLGLVLGARGYGASYRYYARRAEGELEAALAAVGAGFQAAALFGAGAAPAR